MRAHALPQAGQAEGADAAGGQAEVDGTAFAGAALPGVGPAFEDFDAVAAGGEVDRQE
ncbi:hypothetical protein Acor_62930 [Acrocarpospora corrugata]|uniref:Uncharacterized protein n=1 Tax=Acrocarpospora corrugata TaxID=35763 RepID=A0A5M3W5D8_9ACTN|nr:hypothetical protein Acor_62930 [Acrocarpospora corrugata]